MRDLIGSRFVRSSFDEIMWDLTSEFERPDFVCSPRGNEIKEILVPRLVLSDPRNRLITAPERKTNLGFAVGEFLWYWRGSNSLDEMTYYNKRMTAFSDDGITLNSAYGKIIRKDPVGFLNVETEIFAIVDEDTGPEQSYSLPKSVPCTQWSSCVKALENDKDSRRALLLINNSVDQWRAAYIGTKDVPCTLSLQFFIRENKLHLHVNMRSNDVIWGLTYDLFSFTMLQECMLLELKKIYPELKMGRYFHTAGSMHIYDRHYDMAKEMYESYCSKWKDVTRRNLNHFTQPMIPLDNLEDLDKLMELEESLRVDGKDLTIDTSNPTINWMAFQLVQHRKKRDEEQK